MAGRPVVRFAGKLAKSGNSPEECEDDFCTEVPHFALADGASEASYSNVWASILVRSFCAAAQSDSGDKVSAWLEQCRHEWSDWERGFADRELPWFTREKLLAGSFATFIGVSITETKWQAIACGDCCLFVVRDDQLIDSFPIESSELFDNTPTLLSTAALPGPERLQSRTGELSPRDRLYLTSDALASWFLADYEAGEKPWAVLEGISTDVELAMFVAEAREARTMRNDDVTLLSVDLAD